MTGVLLLRVEHAEQLDEPAGLQLQLQPVQLQL